MTDHHSVSAFCSTLVAVCLICATFRMALGDKRDVNPLFAPLPALKHRVAVIAHRGGRGLMPENTLAAIRHAIDLGADYVELDIRATRDGQLVIMHDRSVDRTTNGHGDVKNLEFDYIRTLDAGTKFDAKYAGEKVPTFDECLALCRNRVHIYVDHKEAPTEAVLAAIRKHGMEKQVIVYNDPEDLKAWKRLGRTSPSCRACRTRFAGRKASQSLKRISPPRFWTATWWSGPHYWCMMRTRLALRSM